MFGVSVIMNRITMSKPVLVKGLLLICLGAIAECNVLIVPANANNGSTIEKLQRSNPDHGNFFGLSPTLQIAKEPAKSTPLIQFNATPSPPPVGKPGDLGRGGGTRDNCPNVAQPMTALVPASQQDGGLTVGDRPTILVYIPYQSTAAMPITVDFVLEDEEENEWYKTPAIPMDTAGIIGIPLANTVKLELGKRYTWTMKVWCNNAQRSGKARQVKGWIQRVDKAAVFDANVLAELQTAPPLRQAQLYALKGIWYDAAAILAAVQANDPKLKPVWTELLRSPQVGLEQLITMPILP